MPVELTGPCGRIGSIEQVMPLPVLPVTAAVVGLPRPINRILLDGTKLLPTMTTAWGRRGSYSVSTRSLGWPRPTPDNDRCGSSEPVVAQLGLLLVGDDHGFDAAIAGGSREDVVFDDDQPARAVAGRIDEFALLAELEAPGAAADEMVVPNANVRVGLLQGYGMVEAAGKQVAADHRLRPVQPDPVVSPVG